MFACVLAATLLLCGVRGGGEKLLPPLLWTLCLSGQLWPMRLAFVAGPLRWRAVRFLGAVSYPLYLANEPIQKGLGIALAGLSGGEGTIFTALWLPTALLVPLGVAVLLHRWVETPGLRWGRSLARRGMMPTTMEYGTAGLSAGVGSGAAAAPLCRTGFERR